MNDHADISEIVPVDVQAIKDALGGLYDHDNDPRLVRPLAQQVGELMRLIASHRPEFRRSIPVHWTDTDELIPQVIVALTKEIERLRGDLTVALMAVRQQVTINGDLRERLGIAHEDDTDALKAMLAALPSTNGDQR